MNNDNLYAIVIYTVKKVFRVGGQQCGADGAGTFVKLFYGTYEQCTPEIRKLVNHFNIEDVSVVYNEESYTGATIEHVFCD